MIWRNIDSSGISPWFGLHVQGFLDVFSGLAFGIAFFRWPVAPSNRDVKVGPVVRRVAISSGVLRRKDGLEFEAHLLVGHHGCDIAIPFLGIPQLRIESDPQHLRMLC